MDNSTDLFDIGVIGLGVMGKNLALNIIDNGYRVAAFDLDAAKVKTLIEQEKEEQRGAKVARVEGCQDLSKLLVKLSKPRALLLSIPAGAPIDAVCDALIDAGIEADDIVIDTGNSLWTDTIAREARYRERFIFFSSAVSGGEVGARFGPSLMPSGDIDAWHRIEPIWQAIAAKVDPLTGLPIERQQPGNPVKEGDHCTAYIGPAGSGHFVKMVHNGIEYADMQLICEAYHVLTQAFSMSAHEVGTLFAQWNKGILNSYLMEISADVLCQVDPKTGNPLVEMIVDNAGQKGTGLWTAVSSLQIGCPTPTIAGAVYARTISSQKHQREQLASRLEGPCQNTPSDSERALFIEQLESSLYCAKIASYAQGFQLMAMMDKEQGWRLNLAEIARIWRAGCIIRATFLQTIATAYQQADTDGVELPHLLMAPSFSRSISKHQQNWREAIIKSIRRGVPVPCISSALAYYDSYRSETLPANLLQGQRDFFGAHTFERVDAPAGEKYHLNWSDSDRTLIKL